MKKFKIPFIFLSFLLFGSLSFGHSVSESSSMLRSGKVRTNLLLVKFKAKPSNRINVKNILNLKSDVTYQVLPAFQKSTRFFEQTGSSAARVLGAYYYTAFEHTLSISEGESILQQVYTNPQVEFAYFEPVTEDAVYNKSKKVISRKASTDVVPDFEAKQFYLDPAPQGVDARFGWSVPGGTGKGVRILDLETGWDTSHVEFSPTWWANKNNAYRDHGTAVWGEIAAKRDGVGITGIAHEAQFATAGTGFNGNFGSYETTVSKVLDEAIPNLKAGDILVIEQHAPGPDGNTFSPIEYWQAIFDALKAATDLGAYCIAAAGNGGANLDATMYKGNFDLKVRDSGCILVGAGVPPGSGQWTRESFSNYGSRLDAFGYGNNVVTTGYGDLFRGLTTGPTHSNYTAVFSGTSSATPIVVGAVASVLGVAKAKNINLPWKQVRQALRDTGTSQAGDTTQRIGNLPDIKSILKTLRLMD